jgi:hypothetical protein
MGRSEDPFYDALDAIEDVDIVAEEDSEEKKDTLTEDPTGEEREAPQEDNQDQDPDSNDDDSGEEATDGEEEESPEPADEPQDETEADTEAGDKEEGEGEDDPEPEIEIDGKRYTRSQIAKELEARGLRQEDYTRKTQEAAQERARLAAEREARESLIDEMVKHEQMQEFIADHPAAIKYLLKHPDATRKLLANTSELQKFVEDYEAISANPRLAERFSRNEQDPAVQAELEAERTQRYATYVGSSVDGAIDYVLNEMPDAGVAREDIENHLRSLVGMPAEVNDKNAKEVVTGFQRLHALMFVRDQEGREVIDPRIVRDYVASRKQVNDKKKDSKERKAQDHNSKVDAALKAAGEQKPGVLSGASPGTNEEKVAKFDSFEEVYQNIMS